MKNIQNTNKDLSIGYLQCIRYLVTVMFLVFCVNLLNAQSFETSLNQAAKDLINPVYAIIEMPQTDGRTEYIKILKSEQDKINELENDYEFVRNEAIIIENSITYLKTVNENKTKRRFQVTLTKDYQDTTYLKIIKEASTRIEAMPVSPRTLTERVLVQKGYSKLVISLGKYKITADTTLIKPASTKTIESFSQEEVILEMVEISPVTARWIKRKPRTMNNCGVTGDPNDCQVWCLIEVPTRYEIISKKVLKTPTHRKEIIIPAEQKIVYDSVLIANYNVEEIYIPPLYKTVTKAVVVKPVPDRVIEIPAEYKTVTELSINDNRKVVSFEMPLNNKENTESKTVRIQTEDIIRFYKVKTK